MNVEHRDRLHRLLIEKLYSGPILNNAHRGDFVEMMVWDALGLGWHHVGLGWNLWDLQRGSGVDRVRIQVKNCAALQLWGKTKVMTFSFPWSKKAPSYFTRDFPDEAIESEGWFCDLFVVGIHNIVDEKVCQQTDPNQWQFMVVPPQELKRKTSSMKLSKAIKIWPLVTLAELKVTVESKIGLQKV